LKLIRVEYKEHTMNTCLFCNIQQGMTPLTGGPIFEDELVFAQHAHFDDGPTYLGNLVVETRRHTPDFADLTPDEAQAVGLLISRLSHALKICTGAEKVYVEFYGEVTPHLHVFLTPRYPGTPAEYLRWNVENWPDAPRGGEDEITCLCRRLRAALADTSG
jgi:diadenosine tetraphosphate (Ap4A) HIT family hydrolase